MTFASFQANIAWYRWSTQQTGSLGLQLICCKKNACWVSVLGSWNHGTDEIGRLADVFIMSDANAPQSFISRSSATTPSPTRAWHSISRSFIHLECYRFEDRIRIRCMTFASFQANIAWYRWSTQQTGSLGLRLICCKKNACWVSVLGSWNHGTDEIYIYIYIFKMRKTSDALQKNMCFPCLVIKCY